MTLVTSGFSVIFGFREDVIGLWHIQILLIVAILSYDSYNREVNNSSCLTFCLALTEYLMPEYFVMLFIKFFKIKFLDTASS